MTGYRYVVEITSSGDSSGTEQTFMLAAWALPRCRQTPRRHGDSADLLNPGNYRRNLFTGKRTFGCRERQFTARSIANHQGSTGGWIDYGLMAAGSACITGRKMRPCPSGYTFGLGAHDAERGSGLDAVRIQVRDRLSLLDKPVIGQTFGTGGVRVAPIWRAHPKPRCWALSRIFVSGPGWITGCNRWFRSPVRAGRPCPSVRRRRRADARQQWQATIGYATNAPDDVRVSPPD